MELSNEERFRDGKKTRRRWLCYGWPMLILLGQWAIEDWDDCEPVSVSLDMFKTEMGYPALALDNITVAVFPNIEWRKGKLFDGVEE